jgi:hypothetical protein
MVDDCMDHYKKGITMKIKAGHIVALAVVGLIAVPLVFARPAHRLQAITQLGLPPEKVTCQYCHVAANGRAPWNAFGENIRTIWNAEGKKDHGESLYLALKARKDSDGDGYDDVLEVVAWTQPGNKDSKPNISKDTLEAELKAWGGVDQYKAKK